MEQVRGLLSGSRFCLAPRSPRKRSPTGDEATRELKSPARTRRAEKRARSKAHALPRRARTRVFRRPLAFIFAEVFASAGSEHL